jgi:hypothetical protein
LCVRARSHLGPVSIIYVVLALSLGLAVPTDCQAAKLSTYVTAKDLGQAERIDQNGALLPLGSSHQSRGEVSDAGSTPAYIAVPLFGGEHLPAGIATLVAGPQAGETTVGPLDLSAALKANLDAALAASSTGMAVVDTPKQDYLVEYLPRYARLQSGSTIGTGSTTAAQTSGTTTTATHSTKASSSSAASELSRLLTSGENAMSSLSAKSVAELNKLLDISSKPTATKPSLNLEAQVLGSPQVLPSPIPEPSTWLVFGLILGAAGLRQRVWRGVSTAN